MIDLFLFAVIVGAALWVLVTYYRSYKHAPPGRRGLLPAHVALISVSYLLAIGEVAYMNYSRLGHPFTNFIPINAVVFLTGIVALAFVLGYEKKVVGIKRKVKVEEEFYIDSGIKDGTKRDRRGGDK